MTALYELYDSDNPLSIPVGVKAAGYDDGYAATAWATYGWARFPDALHITVFGLQGSDALDIESGNVGPASAGPWAALRRAQGHVAILYCNRANGPAVEASLRATGLTVTEAMLWIATDDGTQTVAVWDDGSPVTYPVWAVQYLNEAHGSGGHYDRSLVYLAFGGGGGTIGGDELQADERAWLQVAGRYALGPRPASLAAHTDAELLTIYATSNTADLITQYGQDGYAWMSALYHGNPTFPPTSSSPAPASIELDIPSVPGKATGTLK